VGLSSRPARQLSEQVPPRRSRSSMALFDPKRSFVHPPSCRRQSHNFWPRTIVAVSHVIGPIGAIR